MPYSRQELELLYPQVEQYNLLTALQAAPHIKPRVALCFGSSKLADGFIQPPFPTPRGITITFLANISSMKNQSIPENY